MGTALWPAIPTIIPPNTAVVCADVTAGTGVLGAQTDHVGVAGVAIPIVVNTIAHVAGLLGCGGCGAVELGCGDGGGDAEFGGDRGDRGPRPERDGGKDEGPAPEFAPAFLTNNED